MRSADTIAAIATPPGRGGIGVVRVSGDRVPALVVDLLGRALPPRVATLAAFRGAAGEVLDQGLALHFPAPHSYTGEHVVELHGHGGPAVMQLLLARCVELGARLAEPGEFTLRAFSTASSTSRRPRGSPISSTPPPRPRRGPRRAACPASSRGRSGARSTR